MFMPVLRKYENINRHEHFKYSVTFDPPPHRLKVQLSDFQLTILKHPSPKLKVREYMLLKSWGVHAPNSSYGGAALLLTL